MGISEFGKAVIIREAAAVERALTRAEAFDEARMEFRAAAERSHAQDRASFAFDMAQP